MAIASFAISAASQVMSFKAANEQAKAQANAQANAIESWKQGVASAGDSLADQTHQENLRMMQEQDAAVQKSIDLKRELARNKGTALASSEAGGLSEELVLAGIEREAADYSDIIAKNVENEALQSYWTKRGMASQAQSRANSSMPAGGSSASGGASGTALGLGLIGAGLDTYNTFHVKPVKGDIATAGKSK
jgi:hypothetical protein